MIFKNVTFYNEVFQKDVADIQVENGRITAIGVLEQEGRDMQGYTLLPGFVDIHIHGRGGGDFSDGTVSSMDRISASLAKCGRPRISLAGGPGLLGRSGAGLLSHCGGAAQGGVYRIWQALPYEAPRRGPH